MRRGRFTDLFGAVILAGLLAAPPAPWSLAAVVTSCLEPTEPRLAEAGAATPSLVGEAAIAADAITNSRKLGVPGVSRFVAIPLAVLRTDRDQLDAQSGRAPPRA